MRRKRRKLLKSRRRRKNKIEGGEKNMIEVIVGKKIPGGESRSTTLKIKNTGEDLMVEDTDNGTIIFLPVEIFTGLIQVNIREMKLEKEVKNKNYKKTL